MKMKSMFVRTALAAGVMLGMSSSAFADKTGEFTIGADAEFFWPDSSISLERDDISPRLEFGYRFTDALGVRFSYARIDSQVSREVPVVGGHDADFDSYRLEAQYFFNTANDTQPYVSLGAQKLDRFRVSGAGNVNDNIDTQLTAGVGIRHYFNSNFSLNLGANLSNDFSTVNDASIDVGFAYHFGATESSPAAPVTAPAPAACADADGDGVCDTADQCPGTPAGVKVDASGCPATIKEDVRIEMKVLFDYDKALVKDEYLSEVEKVAKFLKEHPDTDATIEGHTDSRGSDAYNQALSERRANAVRDVLVNKYEIPEARLKAVGYGESRPVADNNTDAGRAQNRRVISVIVTEVEKPAN